MGKELTKAQADRLLNAIFNSNDDTDDDYPETLVEKVGYVEYVVINSLRDIAPALQRITRLHRLLVISEKDGVNTLPNIITNNELRMALKPLLQVENDIKDVVEILTDAYKETKPEDKPVEMREGERSCENCGNTHCANSIVAYNWDACVDSNFTKHWMPKKEAQHE